MSRTILKDILVAASIEVVYDALITPSNIRAWWGANSAIVIPKKNGVYTLSWGENEDDPDYVVTSTILEANRPKVLSLEYGHYLSKTGKLPFEATIKVIFQLSEFDGKTLLSVTQKGFPDDPIADDYHNGCIKGWEDTLESIKSFIENRV